MQHDLRVGDDGVHVAGLVGGEGVGAGEMREIEVVLDEVMLELVRGKGAGGEFGGPGVSLREAAPDGGDGGVGEEVGCEGVGGVVEWRGGRRGGGGGEGAGRREGCEGVAVEVIYGSVWAGV